MTGSPSLLALGYRALLRLYPPAFRRNFTDSMAADFADACAEARTRGGTTALLAHVLAATANLARSIPWQWLRSGVPFIALAAALCAAVAVSTLSWLLPGAVWTVSLGPGVEDEVLLVLVIITALFPVLAVVLFHGWFLMPSLRRRPRRRRA